MTTQYIDATPTWENITQSLLLVYKHAEKPSDKNWARDQILEMAQLADKHVEHTKKMFKSINIHYDEGTVLYIEADNASEACEKANKILLDEASVSYSSEYSPDVVHRDYMVVECEHRQKG